MKVFTLFSALLLCFSSFDLFSQDRELVDTNVQHKKVVLEEYTGFGCGNCPDGHRIAGLLKRAQPDNITLVTIHAGYYAGVGNQYDFRTPEGDTLLYYSQAESYGYPCANVSRRRFAGSFALGRGLWIKSSKELNSEISPVNIAAKASIDYETRELILDVELYYTSDGVGAENYLSVALLQNKLYERQNGSSGGEYEHNHVLRAMLSKTFGDTITEISKGSFVKKQYALTLPENYHDVPLQVENVEFAVFVANGIMNIVNGISVHPFITNNPKQHAAEISYSKVTPALCEKLLKYEVYNAGEQKITSLEAAITINGNTETVSWTGEIEPYSVAAVDFAFTAETKKQGNDYSITLSKVNANNNQVDNATASGKFNQSMHIPMKCYMEFKSDLYADENLIYIENAQQEKTFEKGPFAAGATKTYYDTIVFTAPGCHTLYIDDAWGDGIQQPKGYLTLRQANENSDLIFKESISDLGFVLPVFVSDTIATKNTLSNSPKTNAVIYPNPAKTHFYVAGENINRVELYDISGRLLVCQEFENQELKIELASFSAGVYLVKTVFKDEGVAVKKIIKQ